MKTYKEGWYWAIDEDGYAWPSHISKRGSWCVIWSHRYNEDREAAKVAEWTHPDYGYRFEPMALPSGAKK